MINANVPIVRHGRGASWAPAQQEALAQSDMKRVDSVRSGPYIARQQT
jgi:hypothetical protein